MDSLALLDLDQLLGRTEPMLSEAEQNLVFFTCANLPGHSPQVFHLLLIELGPILCRNLECHLRIKKH